MASKRRWIVLQKLRQVANVDLQLAVGVELPELYLLILPRPQVPEEDPVNVDFLILFLRTFKQSIFGKFDFDALPIQKNLVLLHRELVIAFQHEIEVKIELERALHFRPQLRDQILDVFVVHFWIIFLINACLARILSGLTLDACAHLQGGSTLLFFGNRLLQFVIKQNHVHLLELGHTEAHFLYKEDETVLGMHLSLQLPHDESVAIILEVALVGTECGVAKLGGEQALQLIQVQLFLNDSLALEAVSARVARTAEENLRLEVLVLLVVIHKYVIPFEHAKVCDFAMQQTQLDRVHLLLRKQIHDLLCLFVLVAHVALRHFLPQDLHVPQSLAVLRILLLQRLRTLILAVILEALLLTQLRRLFGSKTLHYQRVRFLKRLKRLLDPLKCAFDVPRLQRRRVLRQQRLA